MISRYLFASSLLLTWLVGFNTENADVLVNVINLEKDKERWSKVVTELTEKGVPIEQIRRFPAVHGKSLSQEELKQNTTAAARILHSWNDWLLLVSPKSLDQNAQRST